jgi:hypothetical protein
MISKSEILKFIRKYALILILMYFFQYVFNYGFEYFIKSKFLNSPVFFLHAIPSGFRFILNIITAIIVARDIKKLQLQSRYLILLTVFWMPLGVCLFLISLIINQNENGE